MRISERILLHFLKLSKKISIFAYSQEVIASSLFEREFLSGLQKFLRRFDIWDPDLSSTTTTTPTTRTVTTRVRLKLNFIDKSKMISSRWLEQQH